MRQNHKLATITFLPVQEQEAAFLTYLEEAARQSLLDEVSATPKPGLVDKKDSGAHKDMDFSTFVASTRAIVPFLRQMAEAGVSAGEASRCREEGFDCSQLEQLFLSIRPIGSKAEAAMFAATGGVNTHKGIIFSMGINAAAAGFLYGAHQPLTGEAILAAGQQMCASLLSHDFERIDPKAPGTHGEQLYVRYGCRGIRGEAMAGFPAVRNLGLPIVRRLMENSPGGTNVSPKSEMFRNQVYLRLLFEFMTKVDDSNVLFRCGYEALSYLKKQSEQILAKMRSSEPIWPPSLYAQLDALNQDFIRRNLSAGGCADLLSLTLFLWRLEQWNPEQ